MKKIVVAGGIIAGVSLYKLGQIVGAIKITKGIINGTDEMFPGFKEYLAKETSNAVISKLFHKNQEDEG